MGRLVRMSDRVEATSSCMGMGEGMKLMAAWWLVELRGSGCRVRMSRWGGVGGGVVQGE